MLLAPRSAAPRALVFGATLGLVAVAVLTGCTPTTSGAGGEKSGSTASSQWGDCMRDRGLPVEDPSVEEITGGVYRQPAGIDEARFAEAAKACQPEDTPISDAHRATDENVAKWKKEGSAFVSCMSEHGITGFTEPNDVGSFSYENVDQETPAFTKWQPVCAAEHMPDNESFDY